MRKLKLFVKKYVERLQDAWTVLVGKASAFPIDAYPKAGDRGRISLLHSYHDMAREKFWITDKAKALMHARYATTLEVVFNNMPYIATPKQLERIKNV